ncbi:hypothetical protein HQ545_04145 [Candidatus Woesearchaeota archaeon]|nr:hypothetical protein [Candidatus Woesearchaeota archaeon]
MVILFDQFHLPEDIFEVVFATEQQVIVGRLLVDEFKQNEGTLGKTEMSLFANRLHEGTVMDIIENLGPVKRLKKVKISYNKRQFYDRILTPMRSMGLIDYDMYKKKYLISDKFNNSLKKIGLMWISEINKSG